MAVRLVNWAFVYATLVPASLVFAQGQEHGDSVSLFAGDFGNAIWTLVIFGLLLFVLGKFAWGPILSALQKREAFIRDSLSQAKQDRLDAEARLKELEQRLSLAREEASGIVEEGRRDAEVVKRKIEADARKEADVMIGQAKREIGLARDGAVEELYGLTARLATEVASRIIGKEIDAAGHERLINESIEELGRTSNN